MTSVDRTVRSCIIAYPMLYRNRTDVLHALLCVTGNSYEWQDGEVVRSWPFSEENRLADPDGSAVEQFEANHRFDSERRRGSFVEASESLRDMIEKRIAQEYEDGMEIMLDLDNRVQDWSDLTYEPFPQSESALLLNMPEGVTDDWREACEQVKALVSTYGWKF